MDVNVVSARGVMGREMKPKRVESRVLRLVLAAIALGLLPPSIQAAVCPTKLERDVVALINQERQDVGLAPLEIDMRLVESARLHSEDMATNDFFEHEGSGGSTFDQRILQAGYPTPRSENIAAGYTTVAAVMAGWMGSAGHQANILDNTARHVGVGWAFDSGSEYGTYWTTNFGSSQNEPQRPVFCGRSDFDGDGMSDILWRHQTSGSNALWTLDGTNLVTQNSLATVDLGWEIAGFGDFNGDSYRDILWYHKTSGVVYIWFLNGSTVLSHGNVGAVPDLNWQITGIGDLDGDGKDDVLWYHGTAGVVYVWLLNGLTVASDGAVGVMSDLDWQVAGIGHFDADNNEDVLWYHKTTGDVYLWFMNGRTVASDGFVSTASDLTWGIAGIGDFNGDGRGDILWFDEISLTAYLWFLDGNVVISHGGVGSVADPDWKIVFTGDYNGDGRSDILWYHDTAAVVYGWLIDGLGVISHGNVGTAPGSDPDWRPVPNP